MNDERPIEKLLRRFAKKRRADAGAPVELHPATRRLLQGEVARQFPKASAKRKSGLAEIMASLIGRWGYTASALAIALIMGALLLPSLFNSPKPGQLAENAASFELPKNEAAPAEAADKEVAAPRHEFAPEREANSRQPTSAPKPVFAEKQPALALTDLDVKRKAFAQVALPTAATETDRARLLKDESRNLEESTVTEVRQESEIAGKLAVKRIAKTGAALEEVASSARTDKAFSERYGLKPTTPGAPAIASGEKKPASTVLPATPIAPSSSGYFAKSQTLARGGGLDREQSQSYSQAFANAVPISSAKKTAVASPVSPVLANFRIEQSGNQMRVTDSDGSTYLGEVNPQHLNFTSGGARDQVPLSYKDDGRVSRQTAASRNTVSPSQNQATDYSCRVEGTNRTLNQQVVFSWNFVELTNAVAASQTNALEAANQSNMKVHSQFPAMLQNSAINGRARLDTGREFEINALPSRP